MPQEVTTMSTSTATTVEPVIGDGVMEILQRHDCVAEFWDRVALIRECVPELQTLEVSLLPDPDDDEHVWVDFVARLHSPAPWEEYYRRELRYLAEAMDRFPKRMTPTFPLHVLGQGE
jgi:hypothetical protein